MTRVIPDGWRKVLLIEQKTGEPIEVAAIGLQGNLTIAEQIGDAFAHRHPLGLQLSLAHDVLAHPEFLGTGNRAGLVRNGQLRALAVGGTKRSAVAPDLPTVAEAGVPGFDLVGWAGLSAPRGIPKAVFNDLLQGLHKAVNDSATRAAMVKAGAEPLVGSPQDFESLIRRDWKNYGDAIRVSGLKPN